MSKLPVADLSQPLAGFRVVDLTNVLAGPYCGYLLAQLGADVIKVEAPDGGDLARRLGASPEMTAELMGASFVAQNGGKRSLVLDLKSAHGKAALCRLIADADALVENFRPGVMTRLGLSYEVLRQHNPRLVYCAISGFGQDGDLAHMPAYDQIVQGMSGLMRATGGAESSPMRTGFPVADAVGGLTAAFALAAALAGRERQNGEGCFIDVSMLESLLSAMGWLVSNFLATGKAPLPRGNDNPTASPSGTFAAKDAPLNIAANKQEQFEALCAVVSKPQWLEDARFATRAARLQHRHELAQELQAALAARTAGEWVQLLSRAGVPAGEILSVPQALTLPQIAAREFIAEYGAGAGGEMRAARPGFRINGKTPRAAAPPPTLNQHEKEITAELTAEEATQ